jgi:sugar lactone lactonase YvrE
MLTSYAATLAVCLGSQVIFWTPASDVRKPQGFRLPDWPFVRLNDAAVDPRGSIFAGSMRNNVNPDGSQGEAGGKDGILFRLDPDGTITQLENNIGISNTLVWSPDRTKFYFGDSLSNVIWSYNYDANTSQITKSGNHFGNFSRGLPDGSAIDEKGYIWNCRYGGSCVVRISPGGEVDHVVEMPTRNITNCTFGGNDGNLLYVTTAASPERLSGSLFVIETDVKGLPPNRFGVV